MPLFAEVASAAANPALGVLIFVLGGLAGAVFYLPFKKVEELGLGKLLVHLRRCSALIIVPWVLAFCTSPNVLSVLKAAPGKELGYCFLCGAMWGFGGLTWGLMIRYLGVGLGLAIGCGLCSAAGTLIPPILKGEFARNCFATTRASSTYAGLASLGGVSVSLVGIILVGGAGMSKESELPEEVKKAAVAEYNFKLGMLVAIFSGLMSAGMSFGLQGGASHRDAGAQRSSRSPTTPGKECPCWSSCCLGGFVVNRLWCLFLNLKNKTTGDYVKSSTPLVANLFFAGLAGAIWTRSSSASRRASRRWASDGLHRLVGAVGQRDPVQHDARHRARRMEKHQLPHAAASGVGTCSVSWLRR